MDVFMYVQFMSLPLFFFRITLLVAMWRGGGGVWRAGAVTARRMHNNRL
jgi:hypothetical protein